VVLFRENHISVAVESCEVGNPGTLGMTKGRVEFPVGIGCKDPRSQKRDLGHPSRVHDADRCCSGAQLLCFIQVRLCDKQAEGLTFEEAFVGAFGSTDEVVVRSFFDHTALFEDEDAVEHPHR
jgi:hypothetical protein